MKISFVSSHAISSALRYQTGHMQAELAKMQKEVVSGRVADTGLALGARAGRSVSLARDVQRLKGLIDSNGLVTARLDATQTTLNNVAAAAESFRTTLMSAISGDSASNSDTAQTHAVATLSTITGLLNTSLNGEYLFAGINTDVKPVNNYEGSASKAAFDTAFNNFVATLTPPDASSMTPADMNAFLDSVEPLFLGAGWSSTWSNATDATITSRIALNETAQTSVSANNDGARKLTMATVVVQELLQAPLGAGARAVLVTRSADLVSEAIDDITSTRTTTGLVQARVVAASERLDMQVDLFTSNIHDLEGVDPYEASTKISALLAQIETSYALTARIQQLSLLRYLT